MRKCPELRKLPKAKSIKSINFRHTTPGSIFPSRWTSGIIDASHPAAKLPRAFHNTVFPRFSDVNITIQAIPKLLLLAPRFRWPDPPYSAAHIVEWSEQLERLRSKDAERAADDTNVNATSTKVGSVDMSMSCVLGKKKMHKSAAIRSRTVRRLKTAVSLLVTRDADIRTDCMGDGSDLKRSQVVFKDDGNINPHQWISSDWTYSFMPALTVYRMPYPQLISLLRNALGTIQSKIKILETKWVSDRRESNAEMRSLRMTARNDGTTGRPSRNEQASQPVVSSPTLTFPTRRYPAPTIRTRTKTAFGLRPPQEGPQLEPASDLFCLPAQTSNGNTAVKEDLHSKPDSIQSDQSPPQTSNPSPLPRLFFPTLSSSRSQPTFGLKDTSHTFQPQPSSHNIPITPPSLSTGASIKNKLFHNHQMIRLPYDTKGSGIRIGSRKK